ncbi:MAG TPA: uroporphyrinogen-III C-methyltransferase, partial [Deferrimonas sp.]
MKQGIVYLIGAGPGDPGLITVKGLSCLRRADVVIYDYLANPSFLDAAPPHAERIYVGKRKGVHHLPQEEINALLVEKARQGKTVARLKGGDPYVFGRGGEEALHLHRAGVAFEVIPGVTSSFAAAAYAGIPLTHRDFTTSLALVTGHENPEKKLSSLDWEKLATGVGTLVFYMGMANLPLIAGELMAHGRAADTPVAVIRWATTPRQETLVATLGTLVEKVRQSGIKPPAIIIIGEVVNLRDELRWFDNRPLFGKRILVTRSAEQAGAFSALLEE